MKKSILILVLTCTSLSYAESKLTDFNQAQLDRFSAVDKEFREKYDRGEMEDSLYISRLYPELGRAVSDPEGFLAEMQSRFQKRKATNPEDPADFEFGDYGIPELKRISTYLKMETEKVQKLTTKESELGLIYLQEIQGEVEKHLSQNSIGYKTLVEIGYYAAEILGHFDSDQLTRKEKIMLPIDQALQGKKNFSIQDKLARYRTKRGEKFELFESETWDAGFKTVAEIFVRDWNDKTKLNFVLLPSTLFYRDEIFTYLMPHHIYISGITMDSLPSDGFNRPGGDFWMHDLRHSSAIYGTRKAYEKANGIVDGDRKSELIKENSHRWLRELRVAMNQIEDKDLKEVLRLYTFNFHHDRGYPLVPSMYLMWSPEGRTLLKSAGIPSSSNIAALNYGILRAGGQIDPIPNYMNQLSKAFEWLKTFWLSERYRQESMLLEKKPAKFDFEAVLKTF